MVVVVVRGTGRLARILSASEDLDAQSRSELGWISKSQDEIHTGKPSPKLADDHYEYILRYRTTNYELTPGPGLVGPRAVRTLRKKAC